MNRHVRLLSTALAIVLTSLLCSACAGQSAATILTTAEADVADAQLALSAIEGAVNAYFLAKPNAALQAQVDNAIADTTSALRDVNTALAAATSFSDGNVQSALTSFSQAFAQLVTLVEQIGIQVSSASGTRLRITKTAAGGYTLAAPAILRQLQPAGTAPAKSAGPR